MIVIKGKCEDTEKKLKECEVQFESAKTEIVYIKTDSQNKLENVSKALNSEIHAIKNQLHEKDHEIEMITERKVSGDQVEVESLKKRLKEAEDTLAKYRARQEREQKVLRKELSKTHQVLKKTKVNLDKCKQ